MQDNIQQILANGEQVSRISTQAESLNEQSQAFKASTKELRAKMYWKMWKMRILIAFVVIVALIIIIVPVVMTANTAKSASG
jgi:vesicle-associated membrane protein 4